MGNVRAKGIDAFEMHWSRHQEHVHATRLAFKRNALMRVSLCPSVKSVTISKSLGVNRQLKFADIEQ